MNKFEEEIGYIFNNKTYLERALTHCSYNNEKNTKHQDNERLEFLGDAFLDAVIGAELFCRLKNEPEGKLTKARSEIVCEGTLARVARSFHLGDYLYIGNGEEVAGGRDKDSILADALEAVVAAVYLDGGYQTVESFVLNAFKDVIEDAIEGKLFSDYKSEVQEILQSGGGITHIVYNVDKEEGKPHEKTFYVSLRCNDEILGKGYGKSKKEAERMAAKETLDLINRRKTDVL